MKLRAVIFWMHLGTAVMAMVAVVIMSVTGVLLTYQAQLVDHFDTRSYRAGPPSLDTERLRPHEILAVVRDVMPDARIRSLRLRADPEAPAAISLGSRTIFVNPYTGHVWGEGAEGPRAFFSTVSSWHRSLGMDGERRVVGQAIGAAGNLAVLFIIVSGFFLWWPRPLSLDTLRNKTWFRRRLSGRQRNFNWHNVFGFWCSVPLFIVVLSGVVLSYDWAGDLVYRVVGETPLPRGGGPRGGSGSDGEGETDAVLLSDRWDRAEREVDGWRTITLAVPGGSEDPLVFTIEQGTSGQPNERMTLALDPQTGEVARRELFADRTLGQRLRTYLRFAHTGEIAGATGQTLAAIGSLGSLVLVWTGLAMVWRRFFRRSDPRSEMSGSRAEPAEQG